MTFALLVAQAILLQGIRKGLPVGFKNTSRRNRIKMANLKGESAALLVACAVSFGLQIEFLVYLFGTAHTQLGINSLNSGGVDSVGTDCGVYRACYLSDAYGIGVSALPDLLAMVFAIASLHDQMFARNAYQFRVVGLAFALFGAFAALLITISCRATPAFIFQSVPLAYRLHGPEALAGERGAVVGGVINILWRLLVATLIFLHHPASGKVVDMSGVDESDEEELELAIE